MTVSFGKRIPEELEKGCRLTVYFELSDRDSPDISMGYYEVTENNSSRCILHSTSQKESYKVLKRENRNWKCLRETSEYKITLLGYALWISEYEIHGFIPRDTRDKGKLVLVGVDTLCSSRGFEGTETLSFNILDKGYFDIRLDNTGEMHIKESDGCDVEVFREICTEFPWFNNVTSNDYTDYLRIKLDSKAVIEHGRHPNPDSIRIESIS